MAARRLREVQAREVALLAPLVEVLEVGHGALRVAEEPVTADAARMAFVVVVAGGAVGGADHAQAGRRQQQLHPGVLRLLGHLDLTMATVEGVPHDHGDRLARLGEVVRHVGDQVGALRDLHDEHVGEPVDVHAVLGPHPIGPHL